MKNTPRNHLVLPMLPIGGLLALFLMGLASPALALSKADCVGEQEAYLQASIDHAINPESRKLLSDTDSGRKYIQEKEDGVRQFVHGNENGSIAWRIEGFKRITRARDAQLTIEGHNKSLKEYQQVLDSFQTRPYQRGINSDERFMPEVYKEHIAEYRMFNCFVGVRLDELTRGGSSDKPVVNASNDCPAENVEAANQAMSDIDSQLSAFSESGIGKDIHTITPTTQVVMWATKAQTEIIRKYCPKSAGFKERVSELNAAFKGAKEACRQIQSNPKICVPVAPDGLITSYDQRQLEAANAKNGSTESNSAKDAAAAPAGLCPSDAPIAELMSCLKGRCRDQGFSPVQTKGGCLICGNSEGDLGVGFQWRQCHKSSKGVGAAR